MTHDVPEPLMVQDGPIEVRTTVFVTLVSGRSINTRIFTSFPDREIGETLMMAGAAGFDTFAACAWDPATTTEPEIISPTTTLPNFAATTTLNFLHP